MADENQPVEERAPKRKAKDNPWYRLATLHGQPSHSDDEIAAKNRVTWNRSMATGLPADLKTTLLAKGWTGEELTPFSDDDDELRDIKASTGLLTPDSYFIDFSNTEFEDPLFASRFIFHLAANFESATFADAYFESATFAGRAYFESATFADAYFERATFADAYFERATFADAYFERATFADVAYFNSATFAGVAYFERATFAGVAAYFERATFAGVANFERATFASPAYFERATFANADFERATFADDAYFERATFANADFESATFAGPAYFKSATFAATVSFVNAEMKNATDFDDVTFAHPPRCFNTKLHEGTTWHGVRWPAPPQDAALAQQFVNAYEGLKLEMDKLKKHGDELDFFALEQQCRRVVLGRWRSLPIALYGFLSDYGRSYARPLVLLSIVVVLGAVPLRTHFGGGWSRATFLDHDFTGAGLGLSFANTFSALGIRKELIDPGLLQGLPGWLKVVATAQGMLGLVLLFLFGLGIRNRFRMK
jgi:uncharacterized protein YjbI with pentapeptide repeats